MVIIMTRFTREQVKRLLPSDVIVYIKKALFIIRKQILFYQQISDRLKKKVYAAILSAFPKTHWAYERILALVCRHRHEHPSDASRQFLNYFQSYLKVRPDAIFKWRLEAYNSYLLLHDHVGLHNTMQYFIDSQKAFIKSHQLDVLNFRIANNIFYANYNTHAYLDTHIKAMLLGWQLEHKILVFLREEGTICNPEMLKYWEKYVEVITDPYAIKTLSLFSDYFLDDLTCTAYLNGRAIYIEHAKCVVQKEWERQNRQPLFQLNSEHREFGREQLAKAGIPKDSWFVSLHVRDPGYKKGSYLAKEEYDSYRNADIESYKLAIQEVVQRGGYVIRVGDPKMKPFIAVEGFFDYALSDIRSNRMDIFLFSQCRCFVGVSSGPVLTPVLFGVPVVMTNFVPMSGRPHAGNCIFIPKLLWLRDERRYATFHEVLSSDLGRMFTSHGYEEKRIDIIDNSPEEIRDVVVEMLDRLDGNAVYSEEDEKRQRSITELYQKYSGYGDMGRMGKAFIQNYANQGLP